MSNCYFEETGPDTFIGLDPARGPWLETGCHAGPVTGLVARAMEQCVPDKMLTRLTLNLMRPVPLAGFKVRSEVTYSGRSVETASASVVGDDDKVCVAATSMHLSTLDLGEVPTADAPYPEFSKAKPVRSPLSGSVHGKPSFGDFGETALESGHPLDPGPKTVWMKTLPLLEDERPSPLQSICPLADCGNGLSRNGSLTNITFMNTDLSIHFHREPTSEWLASSALSHWQNTGIGMSQAIISDTTGPVATALQSIILRPIG